MAVITVANRPLRIEARDGTSVLKAAQDNQAAWKSFCGGHALCGTCAMVVVDGKVSEPTEIERYFIEGWGYHPNFRLACQTRALGDLKVICCMDEGYDPEKVIAAHRKVTGEGA
ncbi:MAG TPA: 2Fe-2S iron-sulfur cluster-binding protein [Stellaceae bacterium]|nr:2Fe-2S iron-sulfur cluster-binding protein [Stellaceae bacterium]